MNMTAYNEIKLLLIQPREEDAAFFKRLLSENCFRAFSVMRAESLTRGRELYKEQVPNIIVCDFNLPESQSIETVKKVLEFSEDVPLVFLTGREDQWSGMAAIEMGAQGFLPKHSLNSDFLIHGLLYAMEKGKLQTQLKQMHLMLEHLAMIDPITGLFNRHGIEQIYKREISFKQRYGAEFFVLMVDLDDFEQINIEYGRAKGDLILKETAGNIKSAIRSIDYAARIREDEFLIFFAYTPGQYMKTINERILQVIAECGKSVSKKIQLTASGGCIPVDVKMSFENLLKKTRELLTESKNSGKNRVLMPLLPPKKMRY